MLCSCAFFGCGGENGTGADGGESADSGTADSGAASAACVTVSGAGFEPWFDLKIVGRQFDEYEGARARVVVATEDGYRFGVGDVEIVGGAFTLWMAETLNDTLYVGIGLYIDQNNSDTCDADEPMWDFVTAIVAGDLSFSLTPDSWNPPAATCFINGLTDLTKHLPCPM